jgi:hypothetical protein
MSLTSLVCRGRRLLLAAGLAFVVASGCQEPQVAARGKVVAASGTLTYGGRPVVGAQLTLLGNDSAEPGFAVTDAGGRFKCMTNDSSDGVVPGEYVVTVSRPTGGIPARYSSPESSPLSITVDEAGENIFPLVLED